MYCSNCGNKFKADDVFCSECGKIRFAKGKQNKLIIKTPSFSKNEKKVMIFVFCFIFFVGIYFILNKSVFGENRFIMKYVSAYANNDYETIINLSDIRKNEFMGDDIIIKKYGNPSDDNVNINILSTNINRGEHTRTVQYLKENGSKNVINLSIKKSGQKYLLFNNYVITSTNLTAENIKVSIPKDVIGLKVDGVNMSDKYKYSSNSSNDIYRIKEVLSKNVMLELTLKNDINIISIRNFFDNESVTLNNLYNNSLDDSSKSKIEGKVKLALKSIIEGAINNKDFSELSLSEVYSEQLLRSSLFVSSYDTLRDKIVQNVIYDFNITSMDINDVYLDPNSVNMLKFSCKVNYSYKNKSNQIQNSSRNVMITLNNNDNLKVSEFYLTSLYSLF